MRKLIVGGLLALSVTNIHAQWGLTGNNITSGQFLGTNNNAALIFKRHNIRAGLLDTSNTSFGVYALNPTSTGNNNTANGYTALSTNTTGSNNTAIGTFSLRLNSEGANNTAIGVRALYANTTGINNTATGSHALRNNVQGDSNTASGYLALYSNISGNDNTAYGTRALFTNNYGNNNTAIGINTLSNNSLGGLNTAVGAYTLLKNTTGRHNTAIGVNALAENTTGIENSIIGADAFKVNTTGSGNIVIGYGAVQNMGSGNNNTIIGFKTANNLVLTSNANTIIGANVTDIVYGLNHTIILADGDGNKRLYINSIGNAGFGTTNPQAKLDVNGNVRIGSDSLAMPAGYKLYVQQGILTEKLKVALESSANWADYVFTDGYQLKPLAEVESYISKNKHLPNMPSAEELVKEGGIDVNQMFAKQMEKIEELTLYIIQMNKRIEQLEKENNILKTSTTINHKK